ncbi:hypothetical protein [Spiroplasma melliferum]|uniref:Uncharacterized protein n=2 Tax=Spiroplasma melliferum TaxID=2134 RepID=A0AAI9X0L3_SPIME|nr:hypothetical protein [Spiroplasma melliferum]ELL44176.1 hypothetical protein SMIPMB4A_v3c9060 [Spiroplasma melliferum IPMB4A]KAI92306.1 hypothetical protein SPM_006230 [Spiroplasma melliferum KC3]QCO23739.1 hypothetical protein SRED_002213 [Spiroplasma melliferum]
MKKLLGILSILLSGTTGSFGMHGCAIRGNNLAKTNEYTAEANQDIETFYKIITLIKKKIKDWWDAKALIDINKYFNDVTKLNEFITTLKSDESQPFIGAAISKWPFLEQLINDFKKEVNNINSELAITYNNFYRDTEKEFPILLSDDNIKLKVNKINFDKLSKLIAENKENLNAITISFDINYSVKFKEFDQVYESKGLVIASNNLEVLTNVQENIELWFINFINDLLIKQENKIIDRSNQHFNDINGNNTIWPIIKQELDKKNIITNSQPYFADFFNTLNLWSSFYRKNSILTLAGEGYQPDKLTAKNFLEFYKQHKNIISENNYYVKADIKYFLPGNLTIENLPFKDKTPQWRNLKTPIKVLVPKDKVDEQLQQFAEKIMAFWHYYKLETYNNKLVFKMNQADFDTLFKKVSLFKPESSVDARMTLLFETIFNLFNNTCAATEKIKSKIYKPNVAEKEKVISKFKMETIKDDKNITIKLFRNHYSDGNYPIYYINLSYNDFGYSFFFTPDEKERNLENDDYSFLQTIEFKVG